jgi:ubiquinone/menaquinone biosynthesis C-methylase UbiE
MATMTSGLENNFDYMADDYDWIANIYSCGQIRACKTAQMRNIAPGARVLYAGVGGGEDAVMAARKGAHVTVIDLSPRMLAKASERIAAAGLEGQVECIRGDILEHDRHEYYDVVCANFFLNVFVEPVMREMMQYLVSLLRPGGMLLIADLAPVEGPIWQRMARRIYFGVAGIAFRLLAGSANHPIYDYRVHLHEANLSLAETTFCGPFYWTLKTVRK